MTKVTEDRAQGIIELTVDDEYIDREHFDQLLDTFQSMIDESESIRVIEVVEKFPEFDPALLWDDLKFSYEYLDDITHCAVVSDEGWVGPYARIIGALVSCDIRVFPNNEIEQAREWITSAT